MAARNVADDVHHLALARTVAALVDDCQRCVVEPLGERTRAHHAADVGRDHHQLLITVTRLDIGGHHGSGVEVVGRDIEEALDLACVQIHRQHPVSARLGDEVRHQLGRNRRARAGFAVLPGIAEIGHHCGDPLGRSAAQRVDADQQFHQIVVGRKAGRLDDEHILAAHVLVDLDEDFLVGKTTHTRIGERDFKIGRNGPGKRQVRIAGHDLHRCESPKADG